MVDSVSTENLVDHIKTLEHAGGHLSRVNFTPGNDSAAVFIKEYLESLPNLTSVEVDTFFISSANAPFNTRPLTNIIATIEGAVFPGKEYILGAHYDCSASREGSSVWNSQWQTIKAPGADDNGTGVAAILEIARILSDTTFGFKPDYTIKLIAFGAEEGGPAYTSSHHGSIAYATKAKQNNDNILGMVSIDMVGYNNFYDYNDIVSNESSYWLADRYVYANEIYSIGLMLNSPPFVYATYSDHASFWEQGYKAILMIEGAPPWTNSTYYQANPYYHKKSDSLGTLNMELVSKVTKLNLAAVASLAGRLTDLDESEKEIMPSGISLYQNYPNPFNPATTIKYRLERNSFVTIKIFDLLGKELTTLINEYKTAGDYEIEFNENLINGGLASGVYFYRLSAGSESGLESFVETKKMVYLQ